MEQTLSFLVRAELRNWLDINHGQSESIWIVFQKNQDGTLKPDEALEEALCYGWIDSLITKIDEKTYKKKFSPRRAGSSWSERNQRLAEKLNQEGKMTPWGMQAVVTAQQNGQWGKINIKVSAADVTALRVALRDQEKALRNFDSLNESLKKQFAAFLKDAKQETTQERRLAKIITMLEENKRFM